MRNDSISKENLSLKELFELRDEYKHFNNGGALADDSKLLKLAKKYFNQDSILAIYQVHDKVQTEILDRIMKEDSYIKLLTRLDESVTVIRTGRRIIDSDYSDEVFRKWMIGLFHHTNIGCIGCDKDIPDRVIPFDVWGD